MPATRFIVIPGGKIKPAKNRFGGPRAEKSIPKDNLRLLAQLRRGTKMAEQEAAIIDPPDNPVVEVSMPWSTNTVLLSFGVNHGAARLTGASFGNDGLQDFICASGVDRPIAV